MDWGQVLTRGTMWNKMVCSGSKWGLDRSWFDAHFISQGIHFQTDFQRCELINRPVELRLDRTEQNPSQPPLRKWRSSVGFIHNSVRPN